MDINKNNIPFINADINIDKFKTESFCKNGDIIIADASEDYDEIGKTIEITGIKDNDRILSGLHTLLARDNNNMLADKFRGYLFQSNSLKLQIKRMANGISVLGISKSNIKKIEVYVPSKSEQYKISNIIYLIDKKIELLEKKQEHLENIKEYYLNELFNFKSQDLNKKTLGELCEIRTGKLNANAMVENGKYHFYTCAKEYYYIDKYAFDTEALLISGNGANVGYIHYYKGKFNAYQRTYVLDKFIDEINIKYIQYYLETNLHEIIWREKKEGNTPYIVLDTLENLEIKFPSLKKQCQIVNFFNSFDKKIKLNEKSMNNIRNFKKGLLQKMFV